MYFLLLVFVLVGAFLALVCGLSALRAYLRYRRARAALQGHLASEVERLSRRAGELERGLVSLQARAARLPVTVAELQHSLSTLQVLTGALVASLARAQKVLSYSVLEALGRARPGNGSARTEDRG